MRGIREVVAEGLRVLAGKLDPPPPLLVMQFNTQTDSDGKQWTYTDEGEAYEPHGDDASGHYPT